MNIHVTEHLSAQGPVRIYHGLVGAEEKYVAAVVRSDQLDAVDAAAVRAFERVGATNVVVSPQAQCPLCQHVRAHGFWPTDASTPPRAPKM